MRGLESKADWFASSEYRPVSVLEWQRIVKRRNRSGLNSITVVGLHM
jgi:hypothetical protein